LLPAAYGGILARIRMGLSHSVSDSVRKAAADSEELKRSALLQSFASPHTWAFAENDGRMGELPASALNTSGHGQCAADYCRWAIFQRLLQLASASLPVCCHICTVADGPCVDVNCKNALSLAWCCSQTQRSQQIPMVCLGYLM